MNGLQFIRTFPELPAIILTTAHRDYALDGFELDVVDYLLKPISFERFAKAIAKVYKINRAAFPISQSVNLNDIANDFIYVRADGEQVKVKLSEIHFIESLKNHVRICTAIGKVTTLVSISNIFEKLPADQFLRIHKSYIVSMLFIDRYNSTSVTIKDKTLPIGRYYKKEVLECLRRFLV